MPNFPSQQDSHQDSQRSFPTIRAEFQPLFPHAESLDSVLLYAQSQLPLEIDDSQKLFSILMLYHNTLIKSINPSVLHQFKF